VLQSVSCRNFSAIEEFLYSSKFHLTVTPTFDRSTISSDEVNKTPSITVDRKAHGSGDDATVSDLPEFRCKVFRQYARKIHRKNKSSDPHFLDINIACGKIERLVESNFPEEGAERKTREAEVKEGVVQDLIHDACRDRTIIAKPEYERRRSDYCHGQSAGNSKFQPITTGQNKVSTGIHRSEMKQLRSISNNYHKGISSHPPPPPPPPLPPLPATLHNLVSPTSNMGIFESVKEPLANLVAQRSLSIVLGALFIAFVALSVLLNVLNQALFKNTHEPPVVFHWLPIIGNTITYGIDPYTFFFECRAKVGVPLLKTLTRGRTERLIAA
jgi:hypothetical protein